MTYMVYLYDWKTPSMTELKTLEEALEWVKETHPKAYENGLFKIASITDDERVIFHSIRRLI